MLCAITQLYRINLTKDKGEHCSVNGYASDMATNRQNIYELIDDSISELLHLKVKGHEQVEIVDVLQLLVDIENVIPEFIIDGDEFVKHFNKKHC